MSGFKAEHQQSLRQYASIIDKIMLIKELVREVQEEIINQKLYSLRSRPVNIEHEAEPVLASLLQRFFNAEQKFINDIEPTLKRGFEIACRVVLNQDISILQQIDQGSDEFEPLIQMLKDSENSLMKIKEDLEQLDTEMFLSLGNTTIDNPLQPLIISETSSPTDQALLDIMNKELTSLDSQGWTAEFPVMYNLKSDEQGTVYLIQSNVTLERRLPVRFKLLQQKQTNEVEQQESRLVVKMKCGCYMFADRIGTYFNELVLHWKSDFSINASS